MRLLARIFQFYQLRLHNFIQPHVNFFYLHRLGYAIFPSAPHGQSGYKPSRQPTFVV